jgi:predicted secreted protein
MEGRKAVRREQLAEALRELGNEGSGDQWRTERADIVAALRSICRGHGDNDWKDNQHLGDVISKHLAAHLDS